MWDGEVLEVGGERVVEEEGEVCEGRGYAGGVRDERESR